MNNCTTSTGLLWSDFKSIQSIAFVFFLIAFHLVTFWWVRDAFRLIQCSAEMAASQLGRQQTNPRNPRGPHSDFYISFQQRSNVSAPSLINTFRLRQWKHESRQTGWWVYWIAAEIIRFSCFHYHATFAPSISARAWSSRPATTLKSYSQIPANK